MDNIVKVESNIQIEENIHAAPELVFNEMLLLKKPIISNISLPELQDCYQYIIKRKGKRILCLKINSRWCDRSTLLRVLAKIHMSDRINACVVYLLDHSNIADLIELVKLLHTVYHDENDNKLWAKNAAVQFFYKNSKDESIVSFILAGKNWNECVSLNMQLQVSHKIEIPTEYKAGNGLLPDIAGNPLFVNQDQILYMDLLLPLEKDNIKNSIFEWNSLYDLSKRLELT